MYNYNTLPLPRILEECPQAADEGEWMMTTEGCPLLAGVFSGEPPTLVLLAFLYIELVILCSSAAVSAICNAVNITPRGRHWTSFTGLQLSLPVTNFFCRNHCHCHNVCSIQNVVSSHSTTTTSWLQDS